MKFSRIASGFVSKAGLSLAFASAFILANPTTVSLQDVTSLIAGGEAASADRWQAHMTRSGAGAIHAAEARFAVDPVVTGSIQLPGAGSKAGILGAGPVTVTAEKSIAPATPDEARINRAGKTGRVAAVVPSAPPKAFTAGSVLHRESFLLRPVVKNDTSTQMTFAKPSETLDGKEIQIATAFHKRAKKKAAPSVSPMIADLVTNTNADVLATAYAPPAPDFAQDSPFDGLLKNDPAKRGRFVPNTRRNDHWWAGDPLPAHVFSKREQKCLAEGIYFEARGEVKLGQAAVAQVILNRVRNPTFPNTICGVVYQNDHWRNRCQFSFACDGIRDRITSRYHWKLAQEIGMAVTAGKIWLDDVGSSTHYHATYVSPRWARSMERVSKIGLHIFYRTYDGGWG